MIQTNSIFQLNDAADLSESKIRGTYVHGTYVQWSVPLHCTIASYRVDWRVVAIKDEAGAYNEEERAKEKRRIPAYMYQGNLEILELGISTLETSQGSAARQSSRKDYNLKHETTIKSDGEKMWTGRGTERVKQVDADVHVQSKYVCVFCSMIGCARP